MINHLIHVLLQEFLGDKESPAEKLARIEWVKK